MVKRRMSLSEQIRQAVDDSDMSRYRICQITGISEPNMSRFMSGGWLGQEYMNAIAELLVLKITTG